MPPKQKTTLNTSNDPNSLNSSQNKTNTGKDAQNMEGAGIPGLPELVALVETIAATPPGKEPAIDPNALEVIEATPLNVVYAALKPVFLKLGIAEAAVEARSPWAQGRSNGYENIPQLKSIEEKVDLLSTSANESFKNTPHRDDLKTTSQALEKKIASLGEATVNTLKTSTKNTKEQLDGIHTDVKAVPDTVKAEITTLDVKFAELRKELVEDAKGRIQRLEDKNDVLERELKDLKNAVSATSVTLVPVTFALESAISGHFPSTKEIQLACIDTLKDFVPTDITELAGAVKDNASQLLSYCQALFSVLSESHSEPSGVYEIGGGFDDNWAAALESVHHLRADARLSHEKELESIHKLKFFGFLVDQVRDGSYSLDQWAEASQRQDLSEYIDQPFDGFDALQTVAEEIHRLRRTNTLLKRKLMPSTDKSAKASRAGWGPLVR